MAVQLRLFNDSIRGLCNRAYVSVSWRRNPWPDKPERKSKVALSGLIVLIELSEIKFRQLNFLVLPEIKRIFAKEYFLGESFRNYFQLLIP
jgi:hypothetical protein